MIRRIRFTEGELVELIKTPGLTTAFEFGPGATWTTWDDAKPNEINPTLRRLMELRKQKEEDILAAAEQESLCYRGA